VPAPVHDRPDADPDTMRATIATVSAFIDDLSKDLSARGVVPTLFDVLFVPKDEGFLLSSTALSSGYAVTVTFDTSNRRRLSAVRAALLRASTRCRELGGRVHLVKSVIADPGDLEAMYSQGARQFFAMKRQLDPDGTLRNQFLERTFPSYLSPAGSSEAPSDRVAARP